MSNELKFRATLEDKVTGGLLKIGKGFDKAVGQGSSASLFGNVGAKAVAKGFSLVDQAASAVVGALGDAVRAALEDEDSISRLDASLKANVRSWDGNREAIEGVIKSRMRLGFSDEEQRQSLSLLVAATHDQNKALEVQATAMDLARFKGISLQDATEALTKVEGGSYRILKSLGIQLPKNATATEALTAVQRVATGQAEAYANTNRGKVLASQIKVNEAMERLGYVLLPVVAETLVQVADAAEPVIDTIGGIIKSVGDLDAKLKGFAFTQRKTAEESDFLGSKSSGLGQVLHATADALSHLGDAPARFLGITPVVVRAHDLMGDAMVDLGDKASASAEDIDTANDKISQSFDDMVSKLKSDIKGLIDDVYDPLLARDKLAANSAEETALRKVLASKKSTAAQKKDATDQLHQLFKDNKELYAGLLESGDLTEGEYGKLMANLRRKSRSATGKAKADIDALILKIKKLHDLQASINIAVKIHEQGVGSKVHEDGLAAGGYRPPGWTGAVGEEGQETATALPGGGIYVTPNQGGGGGGGVPVVLQVMLDSKVLAEAVDQQLYYKGQRSAPTALKA